MMRSLKLVLICLLLMLSKMVFSMAINPDDYEVSVDVLHQGEIFHIVASYKTPLNLCQAYRYLTDYEVARNVPGIIESKYTRLSSNKVSVERTADETILLFRVRLNSVLEYIEYPYVGTEFTQVKGNSKMVVGKWQLEPHADGTIFKYQGAVSLDSSIPMFVIEYFIKSNMKQKFAAMASLAAERKNTPINSCDRS